MSPFLLIVFHFYPCYAVLSVLCTHVVIFWELADRLAHLCVVCSCVCVTFPIRVSGQVCNTCLYRFLTFAFLCACTGVVVRKNLGLGNSNVREESKKSYPFALINLIVNFKGYN